MRNAHHVLSWGIRIGVLLCCSLAMLLVRMGSANGQVVIRAKNASFRNVVQSLARENNMNLVMQTDLDTTVQVDFPNPTPVDQVIGSLTESVGLDFWKDGNTYYIGKRPASTETVIDTSPALPRLTPPVKSPGNATIGFTTTDRSSDDDTRAENTPKTTMRAIVLQHTSASEIAWSLGGKGAPLRNAEDKRLIQNRFQRLAEPFRPRVNYREDTKNSSSFSSPWVSDFTERTNGSSVTDAHQLRPRVTDDGYDGSMTSPSGGTTTNNPANDNRTNRNMRKPNPNSSLSTSEMSAFIPDGIIDIVGLVGLNRLLVKAESEDAIDQLEQLIKILDQPIKQVIVEVMYVKMTVVDAFQLGVSWEFAGMPWSVVSSNGGGEGNFAVRYVKGNLKAALATMIATSQAKVVNSPRIIVPNGGGGEITMTETVPFIETQEQQDVFGTTIQNSQITLEPFDQGLTIDRVTIHPDNSVTIIGAPLIQDKGVGVGIPGGSGSVFGSNEIDIPFNCRVKDGETVLVAGFTSKNEQMGGTKAPLLSNIPVLGPLLFKNKIHTQNNIETLLFVTPTIMKEDTTDFGGMQTLPPLF